jgi:hypothetical protein
LSWPQTHEVQDCCSSKQRHRAPGDPTLASRRGAGVGRSRPEMPGRCSGLTLSSRLPSWVGCGSFPACGPSVSNRPATRAPHSSLRRLAPGDGAPGGAFLDGAPPTAAAVAIAVKVSRLSLYRSLAKEDGSMPGTSMERAMWANRDRPCRSRRSRASSPSSSGSRTAT